MSKPQLIDLLYEAMLKEIGLVVATENPILLRTRLYAERKKDPMFYVLSFVLSPTNPTGELWILKSKKDDLDL